MRETAVISSAFDLTQNWMMNLLMNFQVKNKAPAEVQITAEQLLREAKERELELLPPPPKQKITDKEELNDYKLRKRKVQADMFPMHFNIITRAVVITII